MTKPTDEQFKSLQKTARATFDAVREMVEALEAATTAAERKEALTAIHEDPASVEVRSAWHEVGGDNTPAEFRMLLSGGGPATQLIGELDEDMQPTTVKLQAQDWSQPWTDFAPAYAGVDKDRRDAILMTYVQQFNFGS